MAGRGVYFALNAGDEDRLLSAQGDGEVRALIHEDIEERWDEEWLYQTDKAWDAIHRCLTDGHLDKRPLSPRHKLVLGGKHLHDGNDHIVSYLSACDVKEVAAAIAAIDERWLRSRYIDLDPSDYGMPLSEDDFGHTWEYFAELREFLAKAAQDGRAVVFTAGL